MSGIDLDVLSNLPLPGVLLGLGAKEAGRSKPSYRTRRFDLGGHVYGVTGPLWSDNADGEGGRGAISLYRHATGCTFVDAVHHLAGACHGERFPSYQALDSGSGGGRCGGVVPPSAAVPYADPGVWPRVRAYLCERRALDASTVDSLHEVGVIFSDSHANAVFRCAGSGAMLRGTEGPFKANVGRAVQCGPFVAGPPGAGCVVVAEAPIDALSVLSLAILHHRSLPRVLATGGRFIRPEGLAPYLASFRRTYAAQDADGNGDLQADALLAAYPAVKRIRPTTGKDWNDVLRTERLRRSA